MLLGGLDDVVHPGKEFTRSEQGPDGRVTAYFTDGTSATGDVLVGADGANSRVRQQYLPDAHRADTGIVAIAGKLPLTSQTRAWLPERLSGSVNNIMPPRDSFMFTAAWEGDRQRLAVNDPGAPAGPLFDNTQDYVFWAYAAKRSAYPAEPAGDGAGLRGMVASMIRGWHPALLRLVGESGPAAGQACQRPPRIAGDRDRRIRGRDARLRLRRCQALPAQRPPSHQRGPGRAAFRAVLRTTNAMPPLKRRFARAVGR